MIETAELQDVLQGGISGDVTVACGPWSQDFGRIQRQEPLAVVRARSEADVVHCLKTAASLGLQVSFRGAGHSSHGQTLCRGGIVIENFSESAQLAPQGGGRFEISTRSRWRAVERALNAQGRAVPVLTDYQDLSVGGTLSVGGYGFHSITRGLQADHVSRLRLILPDGTPVCCSPQENRELFRFSLAGLGQLGFIESVVMDTVPFRPATRLYLCTYESPRDMLEGMAWMKDWDREWPSNFNAVLYQGQAVSFYGTEYSSAAEMAAALPPEYLRHLPEPNISEHDTYRNATHDQTVFWLNMYPTHRKVWMDFVFGYDDLLRFVPMVAEMSDDGEFADCLNVVHMLALRRPASRTILAFEGPGPTAESIQFGVGLYAMVPQDNPKALDKVIAGFRLCQERSLEWNGRPYLYGWNDLDAATKRRLYGQDYERFLQLKRELDPHGIIASKI